MNDAREYRNLLHIEELCRQVQNGELLSFLLLKLDIKFTVCVKNKFCKSVTLWCTETKLPNRPRVILRIIFVFSRERVGPYCRVPQRRNRDV